MRYFLKLYVTGYSAITRRAISNLEAIKDTELAGNCDIDVIDVLENPQCAEDDKIFVTPTLIRVLPAPTRVLVGDLSNREEVLRGLEIDIDQRA